MIPIHAIYVSYRRCIIQCWTQLNENKTFHLVGSYVASTTRVSREFEIESNNNPIVLSSALKV